MLAFHVGAIGNPEPSNPGFGCLSGGPWTFRESNH
jgi:hypothetical protein